MFQIFVCDVIHLAILVINLSSPLAAAAAEKQFIGNWIKLDSVSIEKLESNRGFDANFQIQRKIVVQDGVGLSAADCQTTKKVNFARFLSLLAFLSMRGWSQFLLLRHENSAKTAFFGLRCESNKAKSEKRLFIPLRN